MEKAPARKVNLELSVGYLTYHSLSSSASSPVKYTWHPSLMRRLWRPPRKPRWRRAEHSPLVWRADSEVGGCMQRPLGPYTFLISILQTSSGPTSWIRWCPKCSEKQEVSLPCRNWKFGGKGKRKKCKAMFNKQSQPQVIHDKIREDSTEQVQSELTPESGKKECNPGSLPFLWLVVSLPKLMPGNPNILPLFMRMFNL